MLRFQIEHHLFPQLPRHNLEKAAPILIFRDCVEVKPFVTEICKRHGIQYKSASFTDSLKDVARLPEMHLWLGLIC